jgi:hypothetical protein
MLSHLARLQAMRGSGIHDDAFARQLLALKAWQSTRLARTYADLAAQPRYLPAVDFFLNDLYAPKDFSKRDAEMLRIYPTLVKLLPATAIEMVGLALELDALSEELDQELAAMMQPGKGKAPLSEARYVEAFRQCGPESRRMRQVELVREVGMRLDAVAKKTLFNTTLKLLRKPAHMAGLGELQEFLERGFNAFRHMKGAEEFLDTVAIRESEIIRRIYSGHPAPFSL